LTLTQTYEALGLPLQQDLYKYLFIMASGKKALRDALASRNPYRVAEALDLPPLSPVSQGPLREQHKETLQDVDGTDWSSVLSFWLDAYDAASKVRFLFSFLREKYTHGLHATHSKIQYIGTCHCML
jgi:hypothetical protein